MTDHEKLRELAQQATPGPWERNGDDIDGPNYAEVIQRGPVDCMSYCYGGSSTIEWENRADAEFIAAANPTAVLALLDELRDAKAKLADAWEEGVEFIAGFQNFAQYVDDNPYKEDAQ